MEVIPGMVVLGRYRVDSVLGTGGMGVVVRATHIYMAQPVAIKFLKADMVGDAQVVQRFLREAHATVRLRGDHIARVIDVGMIPDGTPFMVMEFLEGADLNQILRHHGAQPPALVVDMLLQACEGIAEAHAIGIVHRDIKPSNFFVTRRLDGTPLLKILDFGISKAPTGFDSELTKTSAVVGTPAYMAPEQMISPRGVDGRTDIWSIGIVMYQMLTGRLPFQAEQYAELCIKVGTQPPEPIGAPLPPGLGEVLLRCLEKDPASRFQSVAELAIAMSPFATDPQAAFATADRTRRVLVGQGQGATLAMGQGGGGMGTPGPFTPTPMRGSQSSIGGSAGQMMSSRTQVVGKRGAIIGGTAAIVVGIAAGAYIAVRHKDGGATADANAPAKAAAAGTQEPAPTPDPPAATGTAPATGTVPATAPATGTVPATAPAPATATVPATAPATAPATVPATGTAAAPATGTAPATVPAPVETPTTTTTTADTKPAPVVIKSPDPKPADDKRHRRTTKPTTKVADTAKPADDLFDRTTADKKPTKKPTTKKPTTDKKPSDDDLFDDRR